MEVGSRITLTSDQHAGQPIEHDRGDDDVAAALGLEVPRDRRPDRTECSSSKDPEWDEKKTGQKIEVQDHESGAEAAERRLPLTADVEEACMIGNRHRQAREDEVRGIEQGEADPLP
jgi:hypothetical protein